jgi:hypothetical protein
MQNILRTYSGLAITTVEFSWLVAAGKADGLVSVTAIEAVVLLGQQLSVWNALLQHDALLSQRHRRRCPTQIGQQQLINRQSTKKPAYGWEKAPAILLA